MKNWQIFLFKIFKTDYNVDELCLYIEGMDQDEEQYKAESVYFRVQDKSFTSWICESVTYLVFLRDKNLIIL